MKHTLERLLSFGKSFLTTPTTRVASTQVSIDVDYKTILMSNYVARRVHELAGKPLEISFIYGGNVKQTGSSVKIDVNDFYIPEQQKIDAASFSCNPAEYVLANKKFETSQKRVVALGHSHSDFDVFQSGVDVDNYKNVVGALGIRVAHPKACLEPLRRYFSAMGPYYYEKKIPAQQVASVPAPVIQKPQSNLSYILPSIVVNAHGKEIDTILAVKSYKLVGSRYQTDFSVRDCQIKIYNKQAVLTSADKTMLDYRINKVLSYNGLLKDSRNAPFASFRGDSDNVNKSLTTLFS